MTRTLGMRRSPGAAPPLPVLLLAGVVLAGGICAQDCGDCDLDGVISITDALVASQIAGGSVVPLPTQLSLCDVDLSGSVTILDALLLARELVGQPVELECPPQGVDYGTGTQPLCVAVADVNLDGNPDIVVGSDPAGSSGGEIRIHYGVEDVATGVTTIDWSGSPEETVPLASGSGVSHVFVDDIDMDGYPDLLAVEFEAGRFTVFPGQPACPGDYDTYDEAIFTTTPTLSPISWGGILADMDADGDKDFVCIGQLDGVTIYSFDRATMAFDASPAVLVPGSGPLGVCTFVVPYDPIAVAVGDVTENGLPDVVVAYAGSGRVALFRADPVDNGSARGGHAVRYWSCSEDDPPVLMAFETSGPAGLGSFPSQVHVADVNRDGHEDILTLGSFSGAIAVLIGDGQGGFQPPAEYDFGIGAIAEGLNSQVVDINQDGVLDVVATSEAADTLVYLEGRVPPGEEGTYRLEDARRLPTSLEMPLSPLPYVPSNPAGLAVADLDEDGAKDLVVALTRPGAFQILDLTRLGGLVEQTFVSFNTAISYEAGSNPVDIATGDIVGSNPQQDVVTANYGSGDLSLFEGFEQVGAGLLYPDHRIPMPSAGARPSAVAVGLLFTGGDLVAVDEVNDEVAIWYNNGAAVAPPYPLVPDAVHALPAGCAARDVKIADVTLSGDNDIVVACYGTNSIVVFEHNGGTPPDFSNSVAFATSPSLLPSGACDPANFAGCGPAVLAVGTLDDSHGQDIVVGCVDSYDLAILLSQQPGPLTPASLVLTSNPPLGSPGEPTGLCIRNFDPAGVDTFADVAVAQAFAGLVFSHVAIFGGDGQGALLPPGVGSHAQFTTGLGISDIACRDVDGNGLPDIAVATRLEGIVSVALNLLDDPVDPRFEIDPLNCPAGGDPGAIAIDDVSGDGHLDIITANPASHSVTYVPGRVGGKFLCTLTQRFPSVGIVDMSLGRLDDDANEDLVMTSRQSGVPTIAWGSGDTDSDEFSREDDTFDWDPVAEPEQHNLRAAGEFSGGPVLATDTGDFDFDGDTDVAVLLGNSNAVPATFSVDLGLPAPAPYGGPVVEIFYNTDKQTRGAFDNTILDTHPLFVLSFSPLLPLYGPSGNLLPAYGYGDAALTRSFDLLMRDVNHDGLHDAIVLLPQVAGTNAHLIITLNPGITGTPEDGHFSPERYIDWTGIVANGSAPDNCTTDHWHGPTNGTDYPPAVLTCVQGTKEVSVTQFAFDLGPIDARSVTVTDAYPRDGMMEVVVSDETGNQLLAFGVDHTAELESYGRIYLDTMAPAGTLYTDGYPRGRVVALDPVCIGDPLCVTPPDPAALTVVGGFFVGPSDVVHNDLNDDGRPDSIASLYALPVDPDPAVSLRGFLGAVQMDCTGTVPGVYGPDRWPARLQCVLVDSFDFNRDGKQDAMVVSDQAEVASAFYFDPLEAPALMGPGDPLDVLPIFSSLLVPRVDHVIGSGDQSDLVRSDVNNDGRMDVIISTGVAGGRSEITIMLGSY